MNWKPKFTTAGLMLFIAIVAISLVTYKQFRPRYTIGSDAVARINDRAQEIVNAAFPERIGAAPVEGVALDSLHRRPDGYDARVRLSYTNIVNDKNHMVIELRYDTDGVFLDARIRNCNDRWASPVRLIDLTKR